MARWVVTVGCVVFPLLLQKMIQGCFSSHFGQSKWGCESSSVLLTLLWGQRGCVLLGREAKEDWGAAAWWKLEAFKAELWFHVLSLQLFYNSVGTVHCAQVPERQTIYSGYEGGFVNVSVPAISSAYSRNYSVLEGSIWFNSWVMCLDGILRESAELSLQTDFQELRFIGRPGSRGTAVAEVTG